MSTTTPSFDSLSSFTPLSTVGPYRAADYWALPEGERVELIRGELVMSPAPRTRHQIVILRLMRVLQRAEDLAGGLALVAPTDVVFSDDTILQPDLLYVAKTRKGIVGDRVEGPPDLVIEVLLEGAERRDRVEKLDLYARHGVAEYWIVDLQAKTIEFYVLAADGYLARTGVDNRYQSPRLAEVEIDLAAFWQEVRERMP